MKPSQVGFDGANGIKLTIKESSKRGTYKLRRGEVIPLDYYNREWENQLLWLCPEGKEPVLVYCNKDNELFELDFKPLSLEEIK